VGLSVTNVNRPGANLQTGNNNQIGSAPAATNPMALHIEQYTGIVEGTIQRKSVVNGFVPVRPVKGTSTISGFQVGESTLSKLVPGTEPDGSVNQASKVKLTVDTVVIARNITPMIDDFQNSYDAKKEVGMEHGKKIAKFYDQAMLIQAIKAAGITDMTGYPAGWQPGTQKSFTAANQEKDPAALEDMFGQLFSDMETKDVDPQNDGLVVVAQPWVYYTLLKNDRLVDRTYITSDGTTIKSKEIEAYGVPIWRSNNLPAANITGHYLSNTGNGNAYDGDFSNTVAVAFSPRALLAGETIPLTTDVFWDQRLKAWFIDAYLSFGVTPNNPAFAGLIKKFAG
jgi:hypothetical protein